MRRMAKTLLVGLATLVLAGTELPAGCGSKAISFRSCAAPASTTMPRGWPIEISLFQKALGHDNALVATWLNNRALLYSAQGRYADAAPLCRAKMQLCSCRRRTPSSSISATLPVLGCPGPERRIAR